MAARRGAARRAGGELAQARARYEALLEAHPLAIEAYRAIAPLDAALDGAAAACARIDAAAARFPQNAALARLRAEWTPDEGEAGLAAVRALVAAAPGDVDARGDLALRLARRGRHDEADAALAEVLRLVPYAARPLLIRAQIALWREQRRRRGRPCERRSRSTSTPSRRSGFWCRSQARPRRAARPWRSRAQSCGDR
ncbi:hypothetical protein [Nannocystis pusilla]|uniref:hypothetical protein n=1 Tax=Nannocystis pusilla TaxID=889268 RepID=UPI003B79B1EA